MTQFTLNHLANDRVLVRGTDFTGTTGQVVVDGSQWAGLKARRADEDAHEQFDAQIEAFFAPILEAAENLAKSHAVKVDPTFNVVITEGSEGQAPVQEELVHLSNDSVIIRLIEANPNTERLIWVNDTLEILAASDAGAPSTTVSSGHEDPSFGGIIEDTDGGEPTEN